MENSSIVTFFSPSLSLQTEMQPIHCAALRGNKAILEYLVRIGADVNTKDRIRKKSFVWCFLFKVVVIKIVLRCLIAFRRTVLKTHASSVSLSWCMNGTFYSMFLSQEGMVEEGGIVLISPPPPPRFFGDKNRAIYRLPKAFCSLNNNTAFEPS